MSSLPLMVHELNAITRRRRQDDVCAQDDPNVAFDCPKCIFVLRVFNGVITGDLLDRMQHHDCGGDVA